MLKKHFLELIAQLEFDGGNNLTANALGINPSLISAYKKDDNGEAKPYYVAPVRTLLAIPKEKRLAFLKIRLEKFQKNLKTTKKLRPQRQEIRETEGKEAEYELVIKVAKKIGRHPEMYQSAKDYFGLSVNGIASVMAWNRGAAIKNIREGILPPYIAYHLETLYEVEPLKLLDIFELAGVTSIDSNSKFFKLVKDSDISKRFKIK